MQELTPQQELDREADLEQKFEEKFSKCNLGELYLIQGVLEKEIRLSETAIAEGCE